MPMNSRHASRCWSLLLIPILASLCYGDDIADSLEQLRKVGPEGEGNVEAAAAWNSLTDRKSVV